MSAPPPQRRGPARGCRRGDNRRGAEPAAALSRRWRTSKQLARIQKAFIDEHEQAFGSRGTRHRDRGTDCGLCRRRKCRSRRHHRVRVPFLHGLPSGQIGGQSELASLERANEWLNSPPLTASALRGKVVLIDFWTYTCINWLRTAPYVRAWAEKYKDQGLVVIGVHAPEFAFEKNIRQRSLGRERDADRLPGRSG